MKSTTLQVYLFLIVIGMLSWDVSAQTGYLAGVPTLVNDVSLRKTTQITYSLPTGMVYDSLSLTDKYYLEPFSQDWRLIRGQDEKGENYFISKNLAISNEPATLSHKVSHIVIHDNVSEIYDFRNMLIRTKSDSLGLAKIDTTIDESWDQVSTISPGVTRYQTDGFEMTENLNNGIVYYKTIGSDGREVKVLEHHNVINGEIKEINYSLSAIPVITPTGLCVTRLVSEKYSERMNNSIEFRAKENPFRQIRLFPNPSQNTITLDLSEIPEDGTLSIYDISGNTVFENQKIKNNIQDIDINYLMPGIYILVVKCDGQIINEKFVKQ